MNQGLTMSPARTTRSLEPVVLPLLEARRTRPILDRFLYQQELTNKRRLQLFSKLR
jgi:hypothetical protein